MVKITGPMMSTNASGTLGDAITYGTWKGRPCVRGHVKPANPKSAAQVGRRIMFSFLTKAWAAISSSGKATWLPLANDTGTGPQNAYIKTNMQRWHNFLPPSPVLPIGTVGDASDRVLAAATWEANRIKLSTTATAANFQWGILYFAKLAGAVTPAVATAIIAEIDDDVANRETYWTPPSPGRWYFNSMTFSEEAIMMAAGGAVDTGA